ncbi:MAG: type IV pilus biogenesis/stability protein PilW [Gammaproteobacteria bacterium]|nr:type IV pilus biogenesis/stability protein PilW [Gammaproteobacteria bacterium]
MNSMYSPNPSARLSLTLRLVLLCVALIASACTSTGPRPSVTNKQELTQADKALIHARLARNYLAQKQYAVAKSELEKALRINPGHSDSNYVMALLMMELQQYDTAEKHFTRAVKSNKRNSAAAHDFGMFLCQTGRERRAVDYFELAAANPLFERSELSYMRAGECLSKISDPAAEQYLKRALSVNPELRPALYQLAVLKYQAGAFLSARAYVERYLAVTPPRAEALWLAYQVESKLNALEVAEAYRQLLMKEFPGSEEAGLARALSSRPSS